MFFAPLFVKGQQDQDNVLKEYCKFSTIWKQFDEVRYWVLNKTEIVYCPTIIHENLKSMTKYKNSRKGGSTSFW